MLTPNQIQQLVALAIDVQLRGADYHSFTTEQRTTIDLFGRELLIVNYFDEGVWLVRLDANEVDLSKAERISLLVEAITPDVTRINEICLEVKRTELNHVQQMAFGPALAIAQEVGRMVAATAAQTFVTVALMEGSLFYVVGTYTNGQREEMRLLCSSTPMADLAAIAAAFIINVQARG